MSWVCVMSAQRVVDARAAAAAGGGGGYGEGGSALGRTGPGALPSSSFGRGVPAVSHSPAGSAGSAGPGPAQGRAAAWRCCCGTLVAAAAGARAAAAGGQGLPAGVNRHQLLGLLNSEEGVGEKGGESIQRDITSTTGCRRARLRVGCCEYSTLTAPG